MLIQTPGGVLMVISIALRPGTNWTSWITFALAAVLQGCLLVMCLMWTIRQRKLQIDDFGNPLTPSTPPPSWSPRDEEIAEVYDAQSFVYDEGAPSPVPGLVTTPSEDPMVVQVALENALETASEGHIFSPAIRQSEEVEDEDAPLLRRRERPPPTQEQEPERGWSAWFGR
jgi:hypothetical protein